MALACRVLGIGSGHEVLVPAYNCGTEIDALQHSGARVVGYRVSRQCEIDLADLKARKSERTRAVYLIHYFGWEQPMQELRRWCDAEGLLLVEDCALALFSAGSSGAIGRIGDAAIFSLPKTLGFCHGGLLSLLPSRVMEKPNLALAGFPSFLKEIRHSVRANILDVLERLGLYGAFLSARHRLRESRQPLDVEDDFPQMPDDYYFDQGLDANRSIHHRAWAVAGSLGWQEIVTRRRLNYVRLIDEIGGIKGLKALHPHLPDGVCPLSLPISVSNRDAFVEALNIRGISAFPWWAGFHRAGIDWSPFPDACWLKRNILTFPIHQGIDERHLNYMIETVRHIFQF